MVRCNSTLLPFIADSSARLVGRRAFDVCAPGRHTQIIAGRASDRAYSFPIHSTNEVHGLQYSGVYETKLVGLFTIYSIINYTPTGSWKFLNEPVVLARQQALVNQ